MDKEIMTTKEIFDKAVHKASENGFDESEHLVSFEPYTGDVETSYSGIVWMSKEKIIFSHEFCKSFWGEPRDIRAYLVESEGDSMEISIEEYDSLDEDTKINRYWRYYEPVYKEKGWKYHIIQMVLESDPIQYLAKFL